MAKGKKITQSKSKGKDAKEAQISAEGMSLLERVKHEQKAWVRGKPRPIAKEAVRVWLSIPSIFLGAPEQVIAKLGIEDADVRAIMNVTTQGAMAQLLDVEEHRISEWKKELIKDHDSFAETKAFMKRLTKNVLGSLYRAALSEGDAPRAKLWMQIVESWREQMGIEHSGDVGGGLTDEERSALDKLIAKNTA